MAFSFGSNSPAPAAGGFGAPAPAPGGFGAPAPGGFGAAPAPAAGGFGGFGGAAKPPAAPGGFGSPAPAAGGGLFGSTPAPAPASGGLFGAPVPAPAGGGLFGAPSPAPAAGGFGGFGGATPAPAPGGGLFGAPAPSPGGGLFGAPAPAPAGGGMFGGMPAMQQQQQQQQQYGAPPPSISTQTPYSQLPPQVKQAIDMIHEQMMKHKRSMAQVQTMAPVLLREVTQPADAAAGSGTQLLGELFNDMKRKMDEVATKLQACGREAMRVKGKYEKATTQSIVHGMWPMEALASRKGIKLTTTLEGNTSGKPTNPTINDQIRQSLELQASHVDRLEKIPSPYMWQTLEDMETRLSELKNMLELIHMQVTQSKNIQDMGVASVVQSQTNLLLQVAQSITVLQHRMEDLRGKYRSWESKQNVLDQQKIIDLQHQQKRQEAVKMGYLKAAPAIAPPAAPVAPGGGFGAAPAPGGMFGAPAPAAGGMFGAAAPAAGGGLFGATPAPAFGAAPAPGGGLFGAAPAAGGFGAAAPAPAFGAPAPPSTPAFGASPAPAAGGGLFGAAAPAPAFGAAPAAAAPAFGFGASSSSTKPKSKSRSSRRK
jgi:hypothetical protein